MAGQLQSKLPSRESRSKLPGESRNQCSSPSLITLTTDFGLADSYVGVMKGVMASIAAEHGYGPLRFVDVTHGIAPQDVAAGRFHLGQAVPYFPVGTVHLAVVDPGVGGERRAIAIDCERGVLVGPDNSLFSAVLERFPARAAVELNRSQFWWGAEPSRTFQGRDIFATVAAHLAGGVPLEALGDAIKLESLVHLGLVEAVPVTGGWRGSAQCVDHFGNVVTTVKAGAVEGLGWVVEVAGFRVSAVGSYGEGELGELIALVGSHGWVEVAVNGGSAAERLQVSVGDEVVVSYS